VVPITLKLRNFMAYHSEVALDFQGIRLAALTGENGAGKSSLLDAITWALWGRARAKRDDDLIHLGQAEMEVEYTFDLNRDVYRIIRKRDASRKGRSDLSLHVSDAGGWRTLTEGSLRSTQSKINQLMRLDYDTFINSAFLLQGRADEFTTKPAGERKKILADILGLQIYDEYAERAKALAGAKENEANIIANEIGRIELELAQESKYQAELAEAQREAEQMNQQRQLAEKEMDNLREQYRAVDYKQRQLDDLADRLNRARLDMEETNRAMEAAQSQLDQFQAILARRGEIEAGLEQLKAARERVSEWERRLHESFKLSERKSELEKALAAARAKIETEMAQLSATIALISPKVALIESQRSQLAEAQAELTALQALESERESQRQTLADIKEESARLEEKNKQLKVEMDEIKARLTQLTEAGSSCPVCQRPLDEAHRAEVGEQLKNQGTAKGDAFRRNVARSRQIVEQRETLQQQLTEADRQLRSLAGAQRKVATLEQSLAEAESAIARLAEAEGQRAELQQQLDSGAFAAEVVAQLSEVQAELIGLGYDSASHQAARAEVDNLTHFEAQGQALKEAEKGLPKEEARLKKESDRQARLREQVSGDEAAVARLEEETKNLADLRARLNQASEAFDRLQRDERLARDKVATAKQQLNYLANLGKRRGELEDKLQQVREALGLYRELQVAFGKKGVQALLIESAIPEIEDEANKLLNRMTDSRMHIRFETQREAKSGDSTIETLDIRISDEMGSRDYELYSGGEAFRVNFAIRVALSKVLARRAGARLQTLVMDEGFGTQDVQGRERLVEAINAIQDDFEKIIVITHIDELKDAFPVRIEVWKTGEGSRVAIR
jgi:exonuclease SbcC